MDLLTHSVVTAILIGRRPRTLVAGIGPDITWYLTYPVWVVATGQTRHALTQSDWPEPPGWMMTLHHASHSLIVATAGAAVIRLLTGRWPKCEWEAWALHILVDIPTHSRRFWGPHFLWPISDIAADGIPWAEITSRWLAASLHRSQHDLAPTRVSTPCPDPLGPR